MNICKICLCSFEPKPNTTGNYCSRSCATAHRNKVCPNLNNLFTGNMGGHAPKGTVPWNKGKEFTSQSVFMKEAILEMPQKFAYLGGRDRERGREWDAISKQAILEHPYCTDCPATEDLMVHHIVPYKFTRDNSKDNREVVCRRCHGKKRVHHAHTLEEVKVILGVGRKAA